MSKPIFYDASGKRKTISKLGVRILLGAAIVLFIGLVATIFIVPKPADLDLHIEYPKRTAFSPHLKKVPKAKRVYITHRDAAHTEQAILAFYVPWDDSSRSSLKQHVDEIDTVLPSLAQITGKAHTYSYTPDYQFQNIVKNASKKPQILLVVQNAHQGQWDGENMATLLQNKSARAKLIGEISASVLTTQAQGVCLDFENLPASALDNYLTFLKEIRQKWQGSALKLTIAVPVDNTDWHLGAFAKVTDHLFLMNYDEHYLGSKPGPVASQDWFNAHLKAALADVPAQKAYVAIGNYGYDWHGGQTDALSVQEAWLVARDSELRPTYDPSSGNSFFAYQEAGQTHEIWLLDAASAWNQLKVIDQTNVTGVALWRLGSEDPGIWRDFHAYQSQSKPDLQKVSPIGSVDVEGTGEIIHIDSTPTFGARRLTFARDNSIMTETYDRLPTPYVIHRTGYAPGRLALTFDDGPDPVWTPKILQILKHEGVQATFFVIGEKALEHPQLLNRVLKAGNELGNHSFSHPNLSTIPTLWTHYELNITQRIVEAYTGHSLRLFRAPFFGDAEPTTDDEILPALYAQNLGYTNIGLHVDSEDWQKPGVAAIVKNVLDGVHSGNAERSGQVILLHDSGGDREQTIAALPIIIRTLKAEGYQFVGVSDLVAQSHAAVNPVISGKDLIEVRFDVGIFLGLAFLGWALKWLFIIVIIIGLLRALLLSGLAITASQTPKAIPPALSAKTTLISVIIPAYNEAKVIEKSVKRVLLSKRVTLEVIIVDDGSSDGTADVVSKAFGDEPRVRLLRLTNGGKAHAVNQGLAIAKGDYVIALDADTQFEPLTIARLVRWFNDPAIGAVAGNAKVGNKINLVTRWQAVEYITAQNLERSALGLFDAIMVVPGAVGAWRRSALDSVGGYPTDTLAEDQDLTLAIQSKGWKVTYDQNAIAYTEAPETFGSLIKQRYRWAFGTLQCLWKHRDIVKSRSPKGLAVIGIPQAWLFQFGFSLVSPLIDLALMINIIGAIVSIQQHGFVQNEPDLIRMGVYWLVFLLIDTLCGGIAYMLEPKEKTFPVFYLLSQRFVYRQIMYMVVLRALRSALHGMTVGWGKLERSGRVETVSTTTTD